MDQRRYDEIALQLEAGVDVELSRDEWREFYTMVLRPSKRTAEVRSDNHIGGHTFAYCEQCEWTGVKYGYGVWLTKEATLRAKYEVAFHNTMNHEGALGGWTE